MHLSSDHASILNTSILFHCSDLYICRNIVRYPRDVRENERRAALSLSQDNVQTNSS